MDVLPLCACAPCASNAYGGQKRAMESLELEPQTFLSCHKGARNQTGVLCKSSKCS